MEGNPVQNAHRGRTEPPWLTKNRPGRNNLERKGEGHSSCLAISKEQGIRSKEVDVPAVHDPVQVLTVSPVVDPYLPALSTSQTGALRPRGRASQANRTYGHCVQLVPLNDAEAW